jgi:hypothetical protein
MKKPIVSMILRGKVVDSDLIEFTGRGGDLTFYGPDPNKYVNELALNSPGALRDLYQISLDEIIDYLVELGEHLDVSKNEHLQIAREYSYLTAPTTKPIMDSYYSSFPKMFSRNMLRQAAEDSVGIAYLEGWVKKRLADGSYAAVRAFGARTLHIIAGNGPVLGAQSLIRSALTRGDCLIKVPSNDPFTSSAIGKTMCEMAPDHPITKHFAVGYWRGGDQAIEEKLYQPHRIDKIVAWGGLASIKHVKNYIQPGLELISLDPKRSGSIIGREAFESEKNLKEVAKALAMDIGGVNQIACASARVIYVLSGTDAEGLKKLNRLSQMVYDEMMALPEGYSTKPKAYNPILKSHVDALALNEEWYSVIGGKNGEGAIIASQVPEAVEFAPLLADRTANLVPIDDLSEFINIVDAYTQTVGVYPEALKDEIKDILPLFGAQRFVTLGHALDGSFSTPWDGIEPIRRMCKWIVNEIPSPDYRGPYSLTAMEETSAD